METAGGFMFDTTAGTGYQHHFCHTAIRIIRTVITSCVLCGFRQHKKTLVSSDGLRYDYFDKHLYVRCAMNLNNLYYFVIVAEEMNFTKAAERLFISQQAVSLHIKNLEKELNVQLFQRKPYLMLTKEGKNFYNIALNILKLQQSFYSDTASHPVETIVDITLGVSYGRSYIYGPVLLKELEAHLPLVKLIISEAPSTQFLEQKVLADEVDFFLGVTPIHSTKIETINLSDESLYLVVPKKMLTDKVREYVRKTSHPVISEESGVSLSSFSDAPFVLPSVDNRFRIAFSQYASNVGFRPNILMESSQLTNGFSMALDGVTITVIPRTTYLFQLKHTARELLNEVVFFDLTDVVRSKVVLAYNKTRQLNDVDHAFIDICKKVKFI